MKKNFHFKFAIDDYVLIKELESDGRIISIWIQKGNIVKYEVKYWINGDIKTVYLLEDEIIPSKKVRT
jgi:hypothetical protein